MTFDPKKFVEGKAPAVSGFDPSTFVGEKKEPEQSLGGQAFDLGMKALDYAPGIARTMSMASPAARMGMQLFREATGGERKAPLESLKEQFLAMPGSTAHIEKMSQAMKGKAPTTSEELESMGTPESTKIGGMDVPTRAIAGFAGDVFQDPSGAVSKIKAGTKIAKYIPSLQTLAKTALAPAETAAGWLGKGLFKGKVLGTPLNKIDEAVAPKGKRAPTDIMLENNFTWGGDKHIAEQSADLVKKLKSQKDEIIKQADREGVLIDMVEELKPLKDEALEMSRDFANPERVREGQAFLRELKKYEKAYTVKVPKGKTIPEGMDMRIRITPSQVDEIKTSIYKSIPKGAWMQGTASATKTDVKQTIARKFKEVLEEVADEGANVKPGTLKKLNSDMGAMLTASEMLDKNALKYSGFRPTEVDAMIISYAPMGYALKQGVKGAKTTAGSTGLGKLLPLLSTPAKRGVLNLTGEE